MQMRQKSRRDAGAIGGPDSVQHLGQSLEQVFDQIIGMFEADGQAKEIAGCIGRLAFT